MPSSSICRVTRADPTRSGCDRRMRHGRPPPQRRRGRRKKRRTSRRCRPPLRRRRRTPSRVRRWAVCRRAVGGFDAVRAVPGRPARPYHGSASSRWTPTSGRGRSPSPRGRLRRAVLTLPAPAGDMMRTNGRDGSAGAVAAGAAGAVVAGAKVAKVVRAAAAAGVASARHADAGAAGGVADVVAPRIGAGSATAASVSAVSRWRAIGRRLSLQSRRRLLSLLGPRSHPSRPIRSTRTRGIPSGHG